MSKEKYITRDRGCPKRRCFVPFSGNGRNICRLYELGQCPPQEERKKRGERSSPKTQTRRVVKPQPGGCIEGCYHRPDGLFIWLHLPRGYGVGMGNPFACPYGVPGDRLWVRETFCTGSFYDCFQEDGAICYRATSGSTTEADCAVWRPSIHMPRRASRITLEVTGVRVKRLYNINNEGILQEGLRSEACNSCHHVGGSGCEHYNALYDKFIPLWDSLAKPGTKWDDNPWVWVIAFRRVEG